MRGVQENGLYELSRLAQWVLWLMAGLIVMEVVYGLDAVNYYMMLQRVLADEISLFGPEAALADNTTMIVGLVYLGVYLAAGIASGIWIYRSAWNAREIAGSDDGIRPGWAVGWYFIPIMNFFKPYQIQKRVWQASGVTAAGWLLPTWWGMWLLANAIAQVSGRVWMGANSAEEFAGAAIFDMVNVVPSVICAVLWRRIVHSVTEAQRPAFESNLRPAAAVFE
ncbi:DUF4328 domain-containing protein [Ovoidimarina sediminis]|uniref:DUF4328 domain-containing protein n=1 Tax=Ovoidimarina sediminis TaxID=3079856 RepID=UPI002908BA11|nr:DUF4328 domain-containing protein [Rhodophyticola sp. MJ-SS7]MDU8942369.1 DUF4328 domain-containing protein [Rhodophyticola sp. MJ-SS7]